MKQKKKIKSAHISSNSGYVRNIVLTKPEDDIFAFTTVPTKTDHVFKKVLTIPIYHGAWNKFEPLQCERVSILEPKGKIHFKNGNYQVTVEEFLKEIGQKNKREVNFNLCGHWGFINYHATKGLWNADAKKYIMPEMTEENWTEKTPPPELHLNLKSTLNMEAKSIIRISSLK